MLPALISQLVVINKDTALGYIHHLFVAVNSVLAWAAGRLETRLARRGQRAAKDPAAVTAAAVTAD